MIEKSFHGIVNIFPYFFSPQNFVPHVSLDLNVADFGNCQNLRVIDDKVINLTNHTKGKITVQWIVGK